MKLKAQFQKFRVFKQIFILYSLQYIQCYFIFLQISSFHLFVLVVVFQRIYQKQKQKFVYPDKNICIKIDTFLILPQNRLVYGQLLIGGNCVQFVPYYKFQQKYQVELLLDHISLVRILDSIRINNDQKYKPGRYELINAFAVNFTRKIEDISRYILVPTPQNQTKQNFKSLDQETFDRYTIKSYMADHNILNIQTFNKSQFFFYSKTDLNALAEQEILILGSQQSDILQNCDKTLDNTQESCYIFDQPIDEHNLIENIKKDDVDGIFSKRRRVSFVYNSDDQNTQIVTPISIQKSTEQQDQKQDTLENKYNIPFKPECKNRIDDSEIQKQWKNRIVGKFTQDLYQKYNLLIKLQETQYNNKIKCALTKYIVTEGLTGSSLKIKNKLNKILHCLIKSIQHEQNIQILSQLSELSLNSSSQVNTEQIIQMLSQQQMPVQLFKEKMNFIGRHSMIFKDIFIQFLVISFLPQKFLSFDIFTQYSACRDGQHLNNLYQSYDQAIHDYYPDPPGVDRIDSLNYNINRQNLQMVQNNILFLQLEDKYVVAFIPAEFPKYYSNFGDTSVFFVIFNKELYEQIQQTLDILDNKQQVEQDDQLFIKLQKLRAELQTYRVDRQKIMDMSASQQDNMDISKFRLCYKNRNSFSIANAIQLNYTLLQLTFNDCQLFNFRKDAITNNKDKQFEKIIDAEVIRLVLNYVVTEQDYKRKLVIRPDQN